MKLKPGDRIQLKVRTIGGWKGMGTVIRHDGELVQFRRDGDAGAWADHGYVLRHECARVRVRS